MPASAAASTRDMPLGAITSRPLMVSVTVFVSTVATSGSPRGLAPERCLTPSTERAALGGVGRARGFAARLTGSGTLRVPDPTSLLILLAVLGVVPQLLRHLDLLRRVRGRDHVGHDHLGVLAVVDPPPSAQEGVSELAQCATPAWA